MSRFAIRLVAVCGVLILLQAALFGIAALITTRSFGRLQEQDVTEDVARVHQTLNGQIGKLASTAGDWGAWTDAYDFMRGRNPGFPVANLQPDALTTLDVDMVAFVKPDGSVFSSRAVDAEGFARALPAGLVSVLASRPRQLDLTKLGATAQGVMVLPEGAVIFAARPVTTSAADRPPAGYVLFGRFVSGGVAAELASVSGLDVVVGVLPKATGIPPTVVGALGSGAQDALAEPIDATHMGGYELVKDYQGRSALILRVSTLRAITEAGTSATRSFAIALASFAVLSIALVAYVMYQDQQSRAQLAEEIQAREAFFAAASHDLRTPLNSIIGFTGVVLSGAAGDLTEEQRRQLGMSYRSAQRLLELINDILRIQQADLGQAPECSSFDVRSVVEEIVSACRPQSTAKGLGLEVVGEGVTTVDSDETMVRRVVTNLVSNAIKYTEWGSVSVLVRTVGDEVAIAVRDTGSGIPADAVPHVFDPFYQVPTGQGLNRADSSGLGLAIAQRLARTIHGRITVESVLGEGSTFTLWMPAPVRGEVGPS